MAVKRTARPRLLLALGATLGVVLAVIDLVAPARTATTLPADASASVNGVPIESVDYQRALEALSADRRTPLTDADQRRVLDRLIDEELLVQKGLDLGLLRRDRRVRSDIVSSVVESVVAEATTRQPTDAEVEKFFAAHRDSFLRPGRVRLRQIVVRVTATVNDAAAYARAAEAARRLRAGEDFAAVASALGDAPLAELPAGKLDPATVREYLGPTVARSASELAVATPSDPIRSAAGYHVVEVVERESAEAPPLADVADEVRAELRRSNEDAALRTYVEGLRRDAMVRVREPAQ
jgi:parvulin-like peptidyl-prolyl isomerase